MSYAAHAHRYREQEILTATPQQLAHLAREQVVIALIRAQRAIDSGDHEARITHFDRARAFLGELLAGLDFEQGGDIARQLSGLYAFLLEELTALGLTPDAERLARVIQMASDLRDSLEEAMRVARQQGAEAPAAPAVTGPTR